MRFLHVFPSFATGGREMRAVELMAMLGGDVVHQVIALDGDTGCRSRVPAAVRCEVIEDPASSGGLSRRLRGMRELLRAQRPDLLLTYNWGSVEWLLAARLTRQRAVVHHEDGFGPDETERPLRRRSFGRRLLLPAARAVVVPSRRLYDIARKLWHQPVSRLRYLPNGVDTARFRPAPARAPDLAGPAREAGEASGERGAIVFGCVGRVSPEKNQRLAVEALAAAGCRERARLRVVGDGAALDEVRALARERGVADRVDCVGAVADTAPEYHAIDVFLIPSRTEQMPLALIEAMASGLPVVGTDVGDVAMLVADANREWIVPRGDAAALAAAMDHLAADAALRRRLGAANRERVERDFERAACYGRYVELYETVVRTSAR